MHAIPRNHRTGRRLSRFVPVALAAGLILLTVPAAAEIRSGEIAYPGERDTYSFNIAVGGTYYFDSLTNSGSVNWSLNGPPGDPVVNRAFSASDSDSIGNPLLNLPSGDYTLTVAGSGATVEGYRFQLLNLADATLISMGTVISNTPAVPLSTQLHQFAANAGDVVTFDSLGITAGTAPFWRLVDPFGKIVFANYFTDVNSQRLDATGNYTLLVESRIHSAPVAYGFQLNLISSTPPPAFSGTPLVLGAGITNVIAVAGETNAYTFSLAQPTRLYYDSLTNNGSLRYTLFGPGGTIASTRGISGGANNDLHRAPPGNFQLVISAVSGYTGSFAFRLLNLADATPLTPGTVVSGLIAPASSLKAYRFNATPGTRLFFDTLSQSGFTYYGTAFWSLVDPYGNVLFADAGFGDRASTTLTGNGEYTLWVSGGDPEPGAQGNFSFNLVPVTESSTALALNTVYNGTVVSPGQQHAYTFTLADAKRVYFQSLTNQANVRWTLRGPAGVVQSPLQFNAGGWLAYTLGPGDYTLTISGNGDTTGGFAFKLVDYATATPVTVGSTINGTLTPAASVTIYNLPLTAGDRLFIDTLSQGGFTYFGTAFWRLEDPEGNTVYLPEISANFDRGFGDIGPITVQRTATYRLLVGGGINEPQPTANFSFRILPVTGETGVLAMNTPVDAAITHPGQKLTYTFNVAAPTRVTFDNLLSTPNLSWTLSTPGRTYSANNVFNSDNWYVFDLVPGPHQIVVQAGGDNTGTARFALRDFAVAQPVAFDTTIADTLTPTRENKLYRFTGTAGQRLYFDLLSQSGFTYYGAPYWRLEGPAGEVPFDTYANSDQGPLVLPATGTYTLILRGQVNEAQPQGSVSFRILNSPSITAPLSLNTLTTGALGIPGEQHRYTLTLAQPTDVLFDSRTNNTMNWSLSGPIGIVINNRAINTSDGPNFDSHLRLPAGDHVLSLTTPGDVTGGYAFVLRTLDSASALTLNTTVNGALNPANSTVLYQFTAAAGDRVRFQHLAQSGIPGAFWRLRDPAGDLVWGAYFNGSVQSNLLARTGIYTLQLEGQIADPGNGTYSFSTTTFSPTPPPGPSGTAITIGQTVSNTLPTAATVDSYLLTLSQPARLYVDYLRPMDGFNWALNGPAGPVVAMHSVYTTLNPQLQSRLLPAGSYEFQITGTAAPYSFRILDAAVAPLYATGAVTNDVSPASGALLRRVNLVAGQRYYFDTLSETGFGSSPTKLLSGPAGNLLVNFSGSGDSGVFTAGQTGEHILVIDGQWGNTAPTGTIAFNLRDVVEITNALAFGNTISNTLAGGGDQHHYTFSLATTNRVFFDALVNPSVGWQWSLSGPGGQLVQNRWVLSSDGADIADSSLLLTPGNYRITINSTSDQPSSYQFRLLRDADATPFVLGATVTTNHTPATATSLARFTAAAGQQVYFDSIPGGGFSPAVRLYSPAGTLLSSFSANTDQDTFTLPSAGDYLMSIEGRIYETAASGAVGFALRPVTHSTNTLALNTEITGNITVPGTRHHWQFTLAAPELIWFDAITNAPGATWTLTRGENTLVNARSFLGSDGVDIADAILRLPAGNYRIAVQLGLGNTGDYAFRLLTPASATPLTVGANTAVPLDPPTRTRLLTFTGNAGSRLYFDGKAQTGGGSSHARMYDPFGNMVMSVGTTSDEPNVLLPFSGTYVLAVEGRIYNTGGGITANFALIANPPKSPEPLFEDTSLPDLVVTTVSVTPGSGLKSGDPFTVNWTVRNNGAIATGGAFTDRVSVRNTTLNQIILNTTLAYNPADAGNGPITPGTQRNRQLALTLPAGATGAGSLEVTVSTDTANQVAEYNALGTGESNNSTITPFSSTLAPYPDLRVVALAASPSSGWAAGGTVQFTWGVTNTGPASASTSWVDRVIVRNLSRSVVLLSTNVTHDFSTEGSIAPSGRRNRSAQFIVPSGVNGQGEFEISVEADALSQVVESQTIGSGEDNNLSTIIVRSAPDLQVTSLTVTPSPSAQSGANLLVQWTLTNTGTAPVETAFSDQVQVDNLTEATTLLTTTSVYNPAVQGNGPILPGTTRSRSLNIKLPDGPAAVGQLQIEVGADTYNQVFELTDIGSGEGNNGRNAQLNTTLAPYPDLLARNISITPASPQSGQEITIRWEDFNQGNAPATGNWHDRVQIQNTQTSATLLNTTLYHNTTDLGALINGAARLRQFVFRLPDGQAGAGPLMVSVTVDGLSSVFEHNAGGTAESNNLSSTNFNATLAAYPDLELASFSVTPATFESGRLLTVAWGITNRGTASVSGDFYDRILVRNLTLGTTLIDQSFYFNPVADAAGPIAPGQSRQRTAGVRLPDGTAGAGNIDVALFLDSGNRIFEFREGVDAEANNSTNVTRNSTVALYPDLAVSNVAAPATGLPGQPVDVSWTVANNGAAATSAAWTDQVFLVDDANPNSPQLLASFPFDATLAVGGSSNVTRSVTLPFFSVGTRQLAVKANSGQTFYESSFANNYAVAAATISLAPRLELTLNRSSVPENGESVTATLLRNGDTSGALTVTLGNSDTASLIVPTQATIPAGQTFTSITLMVVNNSRVDGNRTATVSASAPGYSNASVDLLILDEDVPTLTLQMTPGELMEDLGDNAAMGYLTRNTATNVPLVVTLISDAPSRLLPPPTVTIPAGQSSFAFELAAPPNVTIEGARDVRVQASAAGFTTGSAIILVLDNDAPMLELTTAAAAVVEGAESPATTGLLTRQPPLTQPLNVVLGQTLPGLLLLPPELNFAANQASVAFNINVSDDNLVNGTRTNELIARIRGATGTTITNGQATATLLVYDNDGPSLTLTLASDVVTETGSVSGTVSRNTGVAGALTVTLSSSDPGEAVPATSSVVIPNGQSSVSFTVNGVVDGLNDGIQPVILTASANGYNSGTVRLNVSDVDLPDLAVGNIIVPSSGQIDAKANVTFTVSNTGPVSASGTWIDRIFISSDNQLGNDILAGAHTNTAPLASNSSYVRTVSVTLPPDPGLYHIIVVTDADNHVVEGSERNNVISIAQIDVQPNYRTTVETAVVSAPCGTPVLITGRAYYPEDNSPAILKPVIVRLLNGGTRRTFNVLSDIDGTFRMTFTPIPTETGDYQLAADHPRVYTDTPQDSFTLLGFGLSAEYATMTIVPNTPISGQITLRNATGTPLTGLKAMATNAPAALGLSLNLPATLPAHGSVTLDWSMNTSITNAANVVFPVVIQSNQGCQRQVLFTVQIAPLRPQLVAEPAFLNRGMVRGEQALVPFTLRNVGGVPTGPLDVLLPASAWLNIAGTNRLESLEPGAATTVTLLLSPAADLPLIIHGGTIAINGINSSLGVPFQFRAMSTAQGDLRITATDDYTYYVEGGPKLTNAVVTLSDPFTGQVVTNKTTDAAGDVRFVGLPEGAYTVDVTAPKHSTFRGTALIQPGAETALEAFLVRQTVTYRWSVVPVEIEDRYRIVLESVFETEVPVPNVIIEEPYIMPLVFEGETNQFELKIKNVGLIAAENVQITVPIDATYVIQPLVTNIGTLPARSALSIPVLIHQRNPSPSIQLAGFSPKLNGGDCNIDTLPCLPKIPLGVHYYYTCGPNGVHQQRSADLSPICVAKDIKECVEKVLESAASLHAFRNGGNAATFGCDLIKAILQCGGVNLTPCQSAAFSIACGAATGGLAGAGAGAGSGATLECICELVKDLNISIPPSSPNYGSVNYVNGSIIGSHPGAFNGYPYQVGWYIGPGNCAGPSPQGFNGSTGLRPQLNSGGVCARVRLQIDQEAVMTRVAFKGSLEIDNSGTDAISGIRVTLDVRDANDQPAGDRFVVRPPVVTGMGAVDGSGVVAALGLGSAEYLFIPTRDAAPTGPRVYRIGGSLRYLDNGQEVVVPLLSSTITVYPEARLQLLYFQSREVYSDDPFTDEVEPAEPFALGLLAKNVGAGPARNFRITSAQPKIIENSKGLLIDFKIIGSQVGTNAAEPSLTANLGNIPAGQSQVAQWLMTSTLQGKFIEYKATFEHVDNFGSTNLSLIDSVEIHELIKPVMADRAGDDQAPDFLVNDIPDPNSLPDILYLSDGSSAFVNVRTNGTFSNAIGSGARQATLTFTPQSGWQYVRLPDPGAGWQLYRVVRSDNKVLKVGTNVWTTDRTFPTSTYGTIREHRFHLLDFDSTGSYTVYYRQVDTVAPVLLSVGPVSPSFQTTAVAGVEAVFSEEMEIATFTAADVALSLNGGPNLINGSVTVTQTATNRFNIGGLAALTGADGNYELTVNSAGIEDLGGNTGTGSLSTAWAKGTLAPVITALGPVSPNPRNASLDSVEIVFSRAINAATFSRDDVSLTRNGGANLVTTGVQVLLTETNRFVITGLSALTQTAGSYLLTVNAAGVTDTDGVAGTGSRSTGWSMVTTGPRIASLEQPATNPRNIVVATLDVAFEAPIDSTSFTWQDLSVTRNGGPNLVTSAVTIQQIGAAAYRIANFNWVIGQEGDYVFTVNAAGIRDTAGNSGSGLATASWKMDTTRPGAATLLALTPDLGESTSDRLINTLTPTLTGSLPETNLTVRVKNLTTGTDHGTAVTTGTTFSKPLTLPTAGAHQLEIKVVDAAGNTAFPDAQLDLFADLTQPTATITPVVPALRNSAVPVVTLTFSEAIHAATFTRDDLTLTRQSGANLINSGVQVANVVSNQWQITGLSALTDPAGAYVLSLNMAGVQDRAGNPGTNVVSIGWSRTGSNQPPVLAAIADRSVRVGDLISFTNVASDPDAGQNLSFSLGAAAPANAALTSTNGAFSWRPTRSQSPGVYPVTITVTDDGVPPASASRTFIVGVEDYTETQLGETVLLAGENGSLNVTLISTAGLTNLVAELAVPTNRIGAPTLGGLSSLVRNPGVQPLGDGRYRVSLASQPGQSIRGSNVLAQLQFTTAAEQGSAFIPLPLSNIAARQPDGSVVGTTFTQDGRVVMIGDQPLMELKRPASGPATLRLFARPGDAHDLLTGPSVTGPWTRTNRFRFHQRELSWPPVLGGESARFFQLAAVDASTPFFEILSSDPAGMDVAFYATRGLTFDLQSSGNLNAPWTTFHTQSMTNAFRELRLNNPGTGLQFLRARTP